MPSVQIAGGRRIRSPVARAQRVAFEPATVQHVPLKDLRPCPETAPEEEVQDHHRLVDFRFGRRNEARSPIPITRNQGRTRLTMNSRIAPITTAIMHAFAEPVPER